MAETGAVVEVRGAGACVAARWGAGVPVGLSVGDANDCEGETETLGLAAGLCAVFAVPQAVAATTSSKQHQALRPFTADRLLLPSCCALGPSCNKTVAGLLGDPYTTAQMTYDLMRLRLKDLIRRLDPQNRYVVTRDGIKVAVFYSKLHDRLLRPLLAADLPPAPLELRRALCVVARSVDDYVTNARIAA